MRLPPVLELLDPLSRNTVKSAVSVNLASPILGYRTIAVGVLVIICWDICFIPSCWKYADLVLWERVKCVPAVILAIRFLFHDWGS